MPLVAAALVAAACALSALAHPLLPAALGCVVCAAAVALARASGDRPRRILWWTVAAAGILGAVRSVVPLPPVIVADEPHLATLRAALAAPVRALIPAPESELVLGMVLGDRSGIPRDVRTAFGVTGTAHMLAIAGLHLSIVAGSVALILRAYARPTVVAAGTALAAAGYAALAGAPPSVVRAAIMAIVASVCLATGRRGIAANALGAAAAAMLIAEPAAVTEASFQMSVGATSGLVALQPAIARRLGRFPAFLAEPVATTLAASLPTMPITAAIFGWVSMISPLVNLVAVPLLAPIIVFGAGTALVGAVAPWAARPLAAAAFVSATAVLHVVEIGAAVPLAALPVPTGLTTGAAVAALLALVFFAASLVARRVRFTPPRVSRPRLPRPSRRLAMAGAAVVAAIAVVAGAAAAASLGRASGFRLHALDIGQGDAFLVESDGRYALIDGGPDPALVLRRLGEVLPPWQRRIDLIALTHEHADHGAGLLGVIDRYEIGLAIEPVGLNDVPLVRFWGEHLARAHVVRRAVSEGAVIRLGRVTFHVLAPGRERRVDVPSLVIRAEDDHASVLFMGDAVDAAIADLMLAPGALAARVYVPPHHGADTAYATGLVSAVRPEAAVISVGANNKYGHPTPGTLAALGSLPVYRTDRYGTVDVELDGRPLAVHTAKTPLPLDRGGPVPSAAAAR